MLFRFMATRLNKHYYCYYYYYYYYFRSLSDFIRLLQVTFELFDYRE